MAQKPIVNGSGASGQPDKVKVCFVVMPFGRDVGEQRHFKGWFEAVIKPAVLAAGYRPVLAAAEEQPGAINDEIRAHLAFDQMVVVDLGGVEPTDSPNPNVMYELGIRHALGLPLVIMAWQGQALPFDVYNQRAIMEPRDMLSIETNKEKLVTFIRAAEDGKYYKPMEAVGRLATMEAASSNLSEDSILTALVEEVRQLTRVVGSATFPSHTSPYRPARTKFKDALRGRPKTFRSAIYTDFLSAGGSASQWAKVLGSEVPADFPEATKSWTREQWKGYVEVKVRRLIADASPLFVEPGSSQDGAEPNAQQTVFTEEFLERVRAEFPPQPWPTGTHKIVRSKLGISNRVYNKVVEELLRRGIFKPQMDGLLIEENVDSQA